jgi:hypothetical protein
MPTADHGWILLAQAVHDTIPEATMIPRDHVAIVVREWCAARLPALLEVMRADLKWIGVEL